MTSFALAGYGLTYLNAGSFEIDAATLFTSAPADELADALERHCLSAEAILAQARALLVDTGTLSPESQWDRLLGCSGERHERPLKFELARQAATALERQI